VKKKGFNGQRRFAWFPKVANQGVILIQHQRASIVGINASYSHWK
jgi:hypothetical protein